MNSAYGKSLLKDDGNKTLIKNKKEGIQYIQNSHQLINSYTI